MSVKQGYFLNCDRCGVLYPGAQETAGDLRKQAESNGWSTGKGANADVCTNCKGLPASARPLSPAQSAQSAPVATTQSAQSATNPLITFKARPSQPNSSLGTSHTPPPSKNLDVLYKEGQKGGHRLGTIGPVRGGGTDWVILSDVGPNQSRYPSRDAAADVLLELAMTGFPTTESLEVSKRTGGVQVQYFGFNTVVVLYVGAVLGVAKYDSGFVTRTSAYWDLQAVNSKDFYSSESLGSLVTHLVNKFESGVDRDKVLAETVSVMGYKVFLAAVKGDPNKVEVQIAQQGAPSVSNIEFKDGVWKLCSKANVLFPGEYWATRDQAILSAVDQALNGHRAARQLPGDAATLSTQPAPPLPANDRKGGIMGRFKLP